jgi:hypothetical protein
MENYSQNYSQITVKKNKKLKLNSYNWMIVLKTVDQIDCPYDLNIF